MNASAEARVIASFTFIVALLLGAWATIDDAVTGSGAVLPDSELGRLGIALLPFAVTAVAFQAANAATVAWARALGSAAVLLGVVTCIGGVLYFLART